VCLYKFNSTPKPKLFLDHDGNCLGYISPSWGKTREAHPHYRGASHANLHVLGVIVEQCELRFHTSQNHKDRGVKEDHAGPRGKGATQLFQMANNVTASDRTITRITRHHDNGTETTRGDKTRIISGTWTPHQQHTRFDLLFVVKHKKSSRKDSWYHDYSMYSVLLTLPSQAPSCHQMPSPFVPKTAQNIWTQAVSILVERTINPNIEVLLFLVISIEPGLLLIVLKMSIRSLSLWRNRL